MTNMKLDCCVRVEINADYYLTEKKELRQAIKEYTKGGSENDFSMGKNNLLLKYHTEQRIEFDSLADMVEGLEKRILELLEEKLVCVDNWNILYNITRIEGYDNWG